MVAVAGDHLLGHRRVAALLTGRLGQRAVGDQPGARLGRDVPAKPVLAIRLRLAGVPGLGVHHRDHPIRCHPAHDPRPSVGAVGILGRFHVLTRDQRQQPQRVGGLVLALGRVRAGEFGQHRQRVVHQIRHQSGGGDAEGGATGARRPGGRLAGRQAGLFETRETADRLGRPGCEAAAGTRRARQTRRRGWQVVQRLPRQKRLS